MTTSTKESDMMIDPRFASQAAMRDMMVVKKAQSKPAKKANAKKGQGIHSKAAKQACWEAMLAEFDARKKNEEI